MTNVDRTKRRQASKALRVILSKNMYAFRVANGLSQESLAERCGLNRTYIGSVERCERNVTLSTLEAIANALQVTVPQLLSEESHLP